MDAQWVEHVREGGEGGGMGKDRGDSKGLEHCGVCVQRVRRSRVEVCECANNSGICACNRTFEKGKLSIVELIADRVTTRGITAFDGKSLRSFVYFIWPATNGCIFPSDGHTDSHERLRFRLDLTTRKQKLDVLKHSLEVLSRWIEAIELSASTCIIHAYILYVLSFQQACGVSDPKNPECQCSIYKT